MLIPKRLFKDDGFSEEYCEEAKMEDELATIDLHLRYDCCRVFREAGDDHPWCPDHTPAVHATRLASRANAEHVLSGHGKLG